MYPHHSQAIQNVTAHFEQDQRVDGLLLCGSIAHGFENEDSDVDILIILSEDEYQKQLQTGYYTYNNKDMADYPGGYIDGKYTALSFIRQVAEKGSDSARFAFEGAQILFSRIPDLESEIQRVLAYPVAQKADRMKRFRAQLAAWNWYTTEARKKGNAYLLSVAVSKLILFGGRLILVHNEMLYPFHKWFLAVLKKAPAQPEGMMDAIEKLNADPSAENVERFFLMIKNFRNWDENMRPDGWERWGSQYMMDVELTWVGGNPAVDDL